MFSFIDLSKTSLKGANVDEHTAEKKGEASEDGRTKLKLTDNTTRVGIKKQKGPINFGKMSDGLKNKTFGASSSKVYKESEKHTIQPIRPKHANAGNHEQSKTQPSRSQTDRLLTNDSHVDSLIPIRTREDQTSGQSQSNKNVNPISESDTARDRVQLSGNPISKMRAVPSPPRSESIASPAGMTIQSLLNTRNDAPLGTSASRPISLDAESETSEDYSSENNSLFDDMSKAHDVEKANKQQNETLYFAGQVAEKKEASDGQKALALNLRNKSQNGKLLANATVKKLISNRYLQIVILKRIR